MHCLSTIKTGEIQPTLFEGVDKESIMSSFNSFYTYNTTYDMTMQWISKSGKFNYDYNWLSPTHTKTEMINWIRNNFKNAYGIFPEDLEILE